LKFMEFILNMEKMIGKKDHLQLVSDSHAFRYLFDMLKTLFDNFSRVLIKLD